MKTSTEEKVLKASWHAAIAIVGCLEFKRSQTLASKVLSVGLVLWHCDAAICDALDSPTTTQRLLGRLRHER